MERCGTPQRGADSERGQTAVGGVYGAIFAVLVIGVVAGVSYAYIASPAVGAAGSTPTASLVASDIVYEELAVDVETSATTAPARLDPDAVESFFNATNAQAARTHPQITANDLNVNVTLENTGDLGDESIFGGESQISAGEGSVPARPSEYQQPAVLNGEIVTVIVKTWPEQ